MRSGALYTGDMAGEAPTRRRDAIERYREHARLETEAEWRGLPRLIGMGLVTYVPFIYLTYRAWRDGNRWIGGLIFGAGNLLVIGWYVWRLIRDRRHRRDLRTQLRHERRARWRSRRADIPHVSR